MSCLRNISLPPQSQRFSPVSCKTSHSFPFYVCSYSSFLVNFHVWFEVGVNIIRCVKSLVIREMEVSHTVHTTMRYHRWHGCVAKGTIMHYWWDCKMLQPFWKAIWWFGINLPCDPLTLCHNNPTSHYLHRRNDTIDSHKHL